MDEHASTSDESVPSPESMPTHAEHEHIAAMFADREHAEAAVADLRGLGLGSDHLGVAVHSDDAIAFERDSSAAALHDVGVGVATGVPIGFLAGMGIVALAIPGVGVGGMFLLAGVGSAWGAYLGASVGIGAAGEIDAEHEQFEKIRPKNGEVLVVACGHGRGDEVRAALVGQGGELREFNPATDQGA